MKSIKLGSEGVVAAVLSCLRYGPQAPAGMMFNYESVKKSGCSEAHVGLVCDQLVLAGSATQLPDGRYIISSQGEVMLNQLLDEYHAKWRFEGLQM